MELTLNELKILRNALNSKLRNICTGSSEFDDIHKSLNKVDNEIERIVSINKMRAADEVFRVINGMFISTAAKSEYTLDDLINNIEAIDRLDYTYSGSEPYIKIEVDYVMLEDGELETLLSFKDKNKNCVITFK